MTKLVFLSFTGRAKKAAEVYTWSGTTSWAPKPIAFTGTPGPCLEAAALQSVKPEDFLGLYLTDDLLGQICRYTNRHAERTIPPREQLTRWSRLRAWTPVHVPEMKTFLGLLFLTGMSQSCGMIAVI